MRHLYSPSFPFRLLLAVFFTVFLLKSADAQIKIGTNGATIAPASLLELESANQGLLLPRMSDTVAINALNPPNGMLIYLTRQPAVGLYVRKVTGWEYLTGSLGGNGNFNSLNVTGTITAGNFSGPLTGNASTSTLATTATNSVNSAVTNDVTTPGTTYPAFVNGSPGNQPLHTSNSNLTYVPATGILTAKGFNGPLVGDVTGLSTSAVDAQNAVNIKITDDQVTTATVFPVFVKANAGPLTPYVSSTMLSFIPSTGMLSAKGFVGPLNGNATSASTAVNATNSVNSGITNDLATGTPTYPTFVLSASGNLPLRTSSNARLSFVPSTGILTASGFNGPLVGNVTGTATQATDAVNSANSTISNDNTTNALQYPTFVSGITGNLPHRTSSQNFTFNPATGILSAAGFNGNLVGNSTTATNAVTTTITDDIASGATVYPTFVTNISGNWGQRTAGSKFSFVPSTGILTAAGFTSTVTTGIAPFVVASSTAVANLTATNAVNTEITDDVITSQPVYPTFVLDKFGYRNQHTASSRLSFVPSSGQLTAISFNGAWNGAVIPGQYGGTGVANTNKTITLGGNLTTFGAGPLTLSTTGITNVILPTSGTLVAALSGSATLDFPPTVSGTPNELTIPVLGATDGDPVSLGVPFALMVPTTVAFIAWVSAPDIVTVRFINSSNTGVDPGLATFNVKVFK